MSTYIGEHFSALLFAPSNSNVTTAAAAAFRKAINVTNATPATSCSSVYRELVSPPMSRSGSVGARQRLLPASEQAGSRSCSLNSSSGNGGGSLSVGLAPLVTIDNSQHQQSLLRRYQQRRRRLLEHLLRAGFGLAADIQSPIGPSSATRPVETPLSSCCVDHCWQPSRIDTWTDINEERAAAASRTTASTRDRHRLWGRITRTDIHDLGFAGAVCRVRAALCYAA